MTTADDRKPVFSTMRRLFGRLSDQLWYEKHQVRLKGAPEDIAAVVRMDKKIGKILSKFNGVSRMPDAKIAEVEKFVKQAEPAFRRLSAYVETEPGFIEGVFNKNARPRVATYGYLEYNNYYKSEVGNDIEQRIARIRLG